MEEKQRLCPRHIPFGDSALLVEYGDKIDLEINRKVAALDNAIANRGIKEIKEVVPTYRSLLIRYDPLKIGYNQLSSQIRDLENRLQEPKARCGGSEIVLPVVYGGEYGSDLSQVAQFHGLSEEQVVTLHSEREYRVYMIGFVAGFPYMGEVADEIATPRLETPRLRVPSGSVGIAEKQTGIYPCQAPGGWRIIGRTPTRLFDPLQEPPALLKTGDRVRFNPISNDEYDVLSKEP